MGGLVTAHAIVMAVSMVDRMVFRTWPGGGGIRGQRVAV